MLKHLAIAVLLCQLETVGTMVANNVQASPPRPAIAKQEAGHEGPQQPQTQSNNQLAPSPMIAAPQPPTPRCDETCQQGRENLETQNRLAWLTGGLVLVGLFQVGSMIWQAVLLGQTRGDVHAQAEWIKTQAELMEKQLAEMQLQRERSDKVWAEQSYHLREQTGLAASSAGAAQKSAEAALAQIQMVKDKERARIKIGFDDFDIGPFPELGKYEVGYTITMDGTTPATIMEQAILAEIPGYPREEGKFHFSLGLPQTFSPIMSPFRGSTILYKNEWPPRPEDNLNKVRSVEENLLAVVVKGDILYRDIFGDCWKLGFHLRWRNNSFLDKGATGGRWEWLGDNDNGEKQIDR